MKLQNRQNHKISLIYEYYWSCLVVYTFFASGFDLMEVGQDEVTLRTGKQANRRSIQFVLQALLALFGKEFYTPYQ